MKLSLSKPAASARRRALHPANPLSAFDFLWRTIGCQENLRALVQQKRSETDHLVIQLRNLRAQQRQIAAERAAPPDKRSRD